MPVFAESWAAISLNQQPALPLTGSGWRDLSSNVRPPPAALDPLGRRHLFLTDPAPTIKNIILLLKSGVVIR
jgi:hypothetical protein